MKMTDSRDVVPQTGDSFEILPDSQSSVDLSTMKLTVQHSGRESGFRYGSTSYGYVLDIVYVGACMRRLIYGMSYGDAKKLGVTENHPVCRSWNGQHGRGIGRRMSNAERQLLSGGQSDWSWARHVEDRDCESCPSSAGEEWVCRPRYSVFCMIRPRPADPDSEPADWVPAFYEVHGIAVAPVERWRGAVKAALPTITTAGDDGKPIVSPPTRFGSTCELTEGSYERLVPKFGPVKPLEIHDFAYITDVYRDSGLLQQIFTAEVEREKQRQRMVGQPMGGNLEPSDDPEKMRSTEHGKRGVEF